MAGKQPSDSLNRTTLEHEGVLLVHAQLENLLKGIKTKQIKRSSSLGFYRQNII